MTLRAAALFACSLATAFAQTPPAAFEVASVKPHVPTADGGSNTRVTGGRFHGTNVTVRKLIRNAFNVEDFMMSGGPGWIDTESYDIEATTVDNVEITRQNIQPLMLWLLENRFQFKSHTEMKELTEYALEVGKGGSKLQAHTDQAGGPSMSTNVHNDVASVRAVKISVADFAGMLRRQLGRSVTDKTGLTGDFDLDMTWSVAESADTNLPSIFTAIQNLGLRLASTKGPVETIVIDRVEKPSDN